MHLGYAGKSFHILPKGRSRATDMEIVFVDNADVIGVHLHKCNI